MSKRKRRLLQQRGEIERLCKFPDKKPYTKREARAAWRHMKTQGVHNIWIYRCPAKGHWHLGSRRRA